MRRSLITRVPDTSNNEVRFSMLVSLHAYAGEKFSSLLDWIDEPSREWAFDLQERVNRTHGEVYARFGQRGARRERAGTQGHGQDKSGQGVSCVLHAGVSCSLDEPFEDRPQRSRAALAPSRTLRRTMTKNSGM